MKTQRGGLSEFVSRNGRVKLIKLLLTNGWSVSGLAAALGITRQATHLWLKRGETHPCNSNLDKLIDLALAADRAGTAKIVRGELKAFRRQFEQRFANF